MSAEKSRAHVAHKPFVYKPKLKNVRKHHTNKILGDPPTDKKEINALALDLIDWAIKDDSFELEDFPLEKGITPYRFYKLGEINENMHNALYIAKAFIASRMKKGQRKFDSNGHKLIPDNYFNKLLSLYDEEYRQILEARIEKLGKGLKENLTLNVRKHEDIPSVPPRKNSNESGNTNPSQ